jgi:hypothetical protein
LVNWWSKCINSKSMINEKGYQFWVRQLSLEGVKLYEMKSLEAYGCN